MWDSVCLLCQIWHDAVLERCQNKSRIREDLSNTDNGDISLNEGMQAIKKLCSPWADTDHVAVAKSHSASAQLAQEMKKIGCQFIGVVKTSTCKFPVTELNDVQLNKQGKWKSLCHTKEEPGEPDMLAFTWVDGDWRHFVSTFSKLHLTAPIFQCWLCLVEDVTTNAPLEMAPLSIHIPNCAKFTVNLAARQTTMIACNVMD